MKSILKMSDKQFDKEWDEACAKVERKGLSRAHKRGGGKVMRSEEESSAVLLHY